VTPLRDAGPLRMIPVVRPPTTRTRKSCVALLACAIVGLTALAGTAAAAPGAARRPDLTVSSASAKVSSEILRGSATVRDVGEPVTRTFYVTLLVQLAGQDQC
jgi:hypothetical protein